MYEKIRRIILPFVLITLLYVLCFTFLNWFLIVKNKMFDFSPEFVARELSFFIAWIPILIWLRPRLMLLHIRQINRYYFLFFYQLFAAVLMTVCVWSSQKLLYIKLHGFETVSALDETDKFENTDYFSIKNYFLDTSVHPAFRTAYLDDVEKDSADLAICICSPMYKNVKDTSEQVADYWLGIKYIKKISSKVTEESLPILLKEFDAECQPKYKKDISAKIDYYERVNNKTVFSQALDEAANKSMLNVTGADRIFFTPHYDSYKKMIWFAWAKIIFAFIAAIFLWSFAVSFVPFKISTDEESLSEDDYLPYPEKENYVGKFFSFIYPKENYIITPWVLYLNTFMFIALLFTFTGFFSFPNYILYNYGGNVGVLSINDHEYWRLFTSGFEHQGIVHFVINMFFLVIIGKHLEPIIGKWKMLILYFVSLIISGLASAYHNWDIIAVGASGAIMGMFGAFYVLVLTKSTHQKISALFVWSLGIYALINFLLSLLFKNEGIDNAAHLGGLIAGTIMGFIYIPFVRKEYKQTQKLALQKEALWNEPEPLQDSFIDDNTEIH